jgi:hypothetical protein
MVGVLLRTTFEINRAEDTRHMAVRANAQAAEVDA